MPGGAATKLRLLERNKLESGNHRQQFSGLGTDLLAVAKVAGVVIGNLLLQPIRRRNRAEFAEEFGDIANFLDEGLRLFSVRLRAKDAHSP